MKSNIAATITFLTLVAAFPATSMSDDTSNPTTLKARKNNCAIHIQWTSNWGEAAYARYRVETYVKKGDSSFTEKELIEKWCDLFYYYVKGEDNPGPLSANLVMPKCWYPEDKPEGGKAIADISSFIGNNGWHNYNTLHHDVMRKWRSWTGGDERKGHCDVFADI